VVGDEIAQQTADATCAAPRKMPSFYEVVAKGRRYRRRPLVGAVFMLSLLSAKGPRRAEHVPDRRTTDAPCIIFP
jgi:hypothetical protein